MESNFLKINAQKTKAIFFTTPRASRPSISLVINDSIIEFVPKLRCLGVILDEFLSFEHHINHLSASIHFTLQRLYSLNIVLSKEIKLKIAHALLLSKLLYGLEVYSGCNSTQTMRVKLLFNRVARYVYNIKRSDHISEHVHSMLNCNVECFIKLRVILLLYKIIGFQKPLYLTRLFTFSASLRNQQIVRPRIFTSLFEQSFVVRASRIWNGFPRQLKQFSFTLTVFKNRITSLAANNML